MADDGKLTTQKTPKRKSNRIRSRKRVLIFPNGNTLSHIAQALTISEWLASDHMEFHLGVSRSRLSWAARFHHHCHSLPELWEPSGTAFPGPSWFSSPDYIEMCIRRQEELIQTLRPHLIIGIFDFVSAAIAKGIPRLSINGACMLPLFRGVLGFDEEDTAERRSYGQLIDRFWEIAGRAFGPALTRRGLPPCSRLSELLVGDLNLICDIPEICHLRTLPEKHHLIGPIQWEGWDALGEKTDWTETESRPTVYLNAGTLNAQGHITESLLRELQRFGARIVMSTGLNGISETSEHLVARPFFAPNHALALSDLALCTGGSGACYRNIALGVPSLVIPRQPEQATNGINMERAGCGRVAMRNVAFSGSTRDFEQALDAARVRGLLHEMLETTSAFRRMDDLRAKLAGCETRDHVGRFVKELL